MSKNDYYSLVIRRYMQEFLILACIWFSLPVIFSGYDCLKSYKIYFRGLGSGDLGSLFLLVGIYYGIFLIVKVFFYYLRGKYHLFSFIRRQFLKWWGFYLLTGTFGYFDGFIAGGCSISAFRSFLILFVFIFLEICLNQVYDQSIITNYDLPKKQSSLNYLTYIGFEKVTEDLIMTTRGNIPVERISYYYHIERTPFTMTVSRGSYKLASFYRCILNLTLSFLVFYLSINGMIEEQNILRYLGLLLMSLLLVIVEAPTSYELLKKVKKIFLSYQKKGKG
ncbi:hypothetical protein EQ856_11590 [Enterococcus hirae]|uniref:hypothetical protein n=1 Tax=Enterococcus hirae TaxID=1354 RepID=UPI000FF8B6F0|nr:hypothetical protein [Enterococcus hirae]EMF0167160.1 hypothetical protein [Enterococcus hirae]EMF0175113.1 hypothetical protein [Enterococcus hirae]EMF0190360.1 hypothetical protein [Enterococcus hirae]EMF0447870.1 hypothetical protein [Enterococcus hirae]RXA65018.1 hypothetical protein EQ852_12515 [Enterococcus hirae]